MIVLLLTVQASLSNLLIVMSTSTEAFNKPTTMQVLRTLSTNINSDSSKNAKETSTNTIHAEIDTNSAETESPPDTILCVLWKGGKLGAAHFNVVTQQLYILSDMIDSQPEFIVTRNLFREVNYKYVITMGTPCDIFVKFIIDLLTRTNETTIDSDQMRQIPADLHLLPFGEYSYTACQFKIFSLSLPSISPDCSEAEKEIYFHSLLNFDNMLSVHALGALIKYTERNWAHLNSNDKIPTLKFIHINQITMENYVYMDENTFQALQIFQKRSHDANFKHGRRSAIKEGQSIFKLFSLHCKSILGLKCLRRVLSNPTSDINALKVRLNFIDFASQITNIGFIQGIQSSIKNIFDVEEILAKIQHSQGNTGDWEMLYKTIYNTLFLYEQSAPHRSSVFLLSDLDAVITPNLYTLESCIRKAIDFSRKLHKYRPVIKFGIDEELDAKKLRRQDVGEHLTAAANFTINQLPDILTECTIAYIPEMGHLLVTKKNDQFTEPKQLESLGFQFMFELNDTFHYKNAICKELDKHLGHIQEEIIMHELRIIQRISDMVLKYNKDIRQPLEIIALMDCLISMASVAKEKNFICPNLNTENLIDIKNGRHILLEQQCDNIVPNDFKSGGTNSRVKVITGPNSCGKSIYLKQTTLLVYLVHIGSYIPAESANVCMVHSIHSRIQVNESAALRLSAFMIDLSQMSQILYNAKPTSLVIIDEFGKGTTGQDALALLAAALRNFVLNKDACPHILVSTHLQQIEKYLPQSLLLSYHTFNYTTDEENIVFLFKLIDGISSSCAFDVAQAAGLDIKIVDRAREIYKAMREGTPLRPLRENKIVKNAEYYLNIDIPPLDK